MKNQKTYDVIVVGAGPAGLFTAREIVESNPETDILVVDKGPNLENRLESGGWIMGGIGGAGIFSDGTLNLNPRIGGDLTEFTDSEREAEKIIEQVDNFYLKCGAPEKTVNHSSQRVKEFQRLAAREGAKFIDIKQRHIGTENAPEVIENFLEYLKARDVEFLVESRVSSIISEGKSCRGIRLEDGSEFRSRAVLFAGGRTGGDLLDSICENFELDFTYGPVDVGVRAEISSLILEEVTDVIRDPKFHFRSKTHDDFVRTFCTNKNGYVVKEDYRDFIGVNGHSYRNKRSKNTNFAFLSRIHLTKPLENTRKYGESIASLATILGGGLPILHRLGDIRRGKRSTAKRIRRNPVQPTLENFTPGDVTMALPGRIVKICWRLLRPSIRLFRASLPTPPCCMLSKSNIIRSE